MIVAVIGTGVIGSSWACLFLAKGFRVILTDPAPFAKEDFARFLDATWEVIPKNEIAAGASKENYQFTNDILPYLNEVDFVQGNGPERIEIKTKLISQIDAHTRPNVIIASSSSGIPASQFVHECKVNPSRVLIAHPFNPPHLLPLVEVIPHPGSSNASITKALEFYKALGKTPITLNNEVPGFVANRLQAALNNEAYSLVSRGVISAQDLDTAVTNGPGLRWALNGPFQTNALGGDGGTAGFSHRLQHLGPEIQKWERDMSGHRFDWSEAALGSLTDAVGVYLDGMDPADVKRERDKKLLRILELKRLWNGS